ncbi:MAG TPA: murein biosynthesis integral membrane protein MurJ [bacterium]|nr:murein biosynthesis integral membrane protein MurJ [Chlamydiota bacterium]HOE27958.1 murein biosynthesis integral membrane protein MurJ [bacterium]
MRRIARASMLLAAASAGCHVLGLVKEMLIAGQFGISRAMDAFYAALAVPHALNNILLSAFGAVFIPAYVRHALLGNEAADRVAAAALRRLGLILALAAAALFAGAPLVIGLGFRGLPPDGAGEAVRILKVVAFTMVLSGAAGALSGVLNARAHFFWPAVSPVLVTLVSIVFIVLGAQRMGVMALAWGLGAGLLAQCLVLAAAARREGFRPAFLDARGEPAVREMTAGALLLIVGIVAAQGNVLVDSVMASYLAPGSLAALSYAAKLVMVPLVVFTGSLATAAFPHFSKQAAGGRIAELKEALAASIRMAGFVFLPLTVALVILARPLIALLFQRGAFDREAAELTSAILACYAPQMFFCTVSILLVRVHLALDERAVMVKVAFAGVGMNVAFNLLFIRLIDPPAAGLALSTSLVQCIASWLFYLPLARRIGALHAQDLLPALLRTACASAAMAAAILAASAAAGARGAGPVACLAVSAAAGAVVFPAAARLLGSTELDGLARLARDACRLRRPGGSR